MGKVADLPKIDVATAAQAAKQYFAQLFPSSHYNHHLEEVEFSDDEKFWLITLSCERRSGPLDEIDPMKQFLNPEKTKYKIFKVDAQTGKVLSMKMRPIE